MNAAGRKRTAAKLPVSGSPTRERETHGAVIAVASIPTEDAVAYPGVNMHRVQSPIERYAARGSLTKRQADAALDLRADWEFGIVGARDSSRRGAGGGPGGIADAQLDAARAYRMAIQAMGNSVSAVVLPIVIGLADGSEVTVEMLAALRSANDLSRRNGDRKHIMGTLRLGLDALADHYRLSSDRRRAAKYA